MKEYIGDSVYVTIERGMIRLTTEQGDGRASNTIYLEPDVFKQLTLFARRYRVDVLSGFVEKT